MKPHTGTAGSAPVPPPCGTSDRSPSRLSRGSPGGGRRGELRRSLAIPPHGRIQRAPPSSHFLQLLLYQSSAGRRGRAAAQPRGAPAPLLSAGTGAPSPGGRGRGWPGYAAGLAVTIPPFPRHFVTVLAFSQSRDRAGALGTGPRCAGADAAPAPCPRSLSPPARPPGSGAGPGTRGHRRLLPTGIAPLPFAPPARSTRGSWLPEPQQDPVTRGWHRAPGRCPQVEDAGARFPSSLPHGPGTPRWSPPSAQPMGSAGALRAGGTVPWGRVRSGAVPPGTAPSASPGLGGGPGSPGTNPNALAGTLWGQWLAHARPGAPSGLTAWPDRRGGWQGNGGRWPGRTAGQRWRRGAGRAGQRMPRRGRPVPPPVRG